MAPSALTMVRAPPTASMEPPALPLPEPKVNVPVPSGREDHRSRSGADQGPVGVSLAI
jgi:hypothetical protein